MTGANPYIFRLKTFLPPPRTRACSKPFPLNIDRKNNCSPFAASPFLHPASASGYQLPRGASFICLINIHLCICGEMRYFFELRCDFQQEITYALRLEEHAPLLHQLYPAFSLDVHRVRERCGSWRLLKTVPTFFFIRHLQILLSFRVRLRSELNQFS